MWNPQFIYGHSKLEKSINHLLAYQIDIWISRPVGKRDVVAEYINLMDGNVSSWEWLDSTAWWLQTEEIRVYQVYMVYTLNLRYVIGQLHLSKAGKNKITAEMKIKNEFSKQVLAILTCGGQRQPAKSQGSRFEMKTDTKGKNVV